jgi:hypothetical protein
LFVISLAGQISFNLDNLVIGAWLGPAAVAVYTIALRLSEYQRRLCDQFSGMLFPVVMAFGADGDREALKRTLVEGNRIAMTLVTGASVCLIGFSGPLIVGWMGPAFAGSVVPFNVLALAGLIVVSQAASSNVLIALGRHRVVTWIWLGSRRQPDAEPCAGSNDGSRRRRRRHARAARGRPSGGDVDRRLPRGRRPGRAMPLRDCVRRPWQACWRRWSVRAFGWRGRPPRRQQLSWKRASSGSFTSRR